MSKGKNTPVIIGGIAAGAVIVALSVAVVHLVSQKGNEEQTQSTRQPEKRNVVITESNMDEVAESIANQEYTPIGYYTASMSTTWHFETGDAVSEDAIVRNRSYNTNDVYFDVFLAEDEETPILQSPVIPRGAELTQISLDTPLDAGSYDCVLIYHLIDDDQNTLSTLRVGLTIIVKSNPKTAEP